MNSGPCGSKPDTLTKRLRGEDSDSDTEYWKGILLQITSQFTACLLARRRCYRAIALLFSHIHMFCLASLRGRERGGRECRDLTLKIVSVAAPPPPRTDGRERCSPGWLPCCHARCLAAWPAGGRAALALPELKVF